MLDLHECLVVRGGDLQKNCLHTAIAWSSNGGLQREFRTQSDVEQTESITAYDLLMTADMSTPCDFC